MLKESNIDAGNLIKKVNNRLESKQQILSYDVWPENDFPRLNNLKVDRRKVLELSNSHIPKNKVRERLDTSSLISILTSLSGKKMHSSTRYCFLFYKCTPMFF